MGRNAGDMSGADIGFNFLRGLRPWGRAYGKAKPWNPNAWPWTMKKACARPTNR